MKYLTKLIFVLLLTAGMSSCSDYLNPKTIGNQRIKSINDVNDLQGIIVGAYDRLSQNDLYGRNLIIYGDVRTANAFSNGRSGRFDSFAIFDILAGSGYANVTWDASYETIANTNIIINSDVGASGQEINQVKGQAYAIRALSYMNLLLLYGQQYVDGSNLGIPYVTTFGEEKNFYPNRLTVEKSWNKIGADFKKAVQLLADSVNYPPIKIDYYAARALQARYFLYTGNYAAAAEAAKDVIESGQFSLVPASEYVAAWANDGQPAVLFEIAMTQTDNPGIDGVSFMIKNTGYGDVEITEELYKLYGESDVRKDLYTTNKPEDGNRIHYRIPGKYPDRYKNIPVIRYAGVILIYAEAQARMGNMAEALQYLNKIPNHRNADPYAVASIDNILLERRKELAMEGLFYWDVLRTGHDIVRQGMRNLVSAQEVTVPFGAPKLALPIPSEELEANPNIKQNLGYR